ncbi:hypothetical protein D3C72_2089370 [compost metagenome]
MSRTVSKVFIMSSTYRGASDPAAAASNAESEQKLYPFESSAAMASLLKEAGTNLAEICHRVFERGPQPWDKLQRKRMELLEVVNILALLAGPLQRMEEAGNFIDVERG